MEDPLFAKINERPVPQLVRGRRLEEWTGDELPGLAQHPFELPVEIRERLAQAEVRREVGNETVPEGIG